ncbi:hypothetical protein MM300_10135 [Evansella sp. LMS18]|uniref:hypothetical protein n=1 Tax=Evansella sp. LMS18 TaxID=2924033 RepID=UPI0020D09C0F|nr:hypothetical protein [Evansella sp. LMS18]UTR12596.1 hypothetical protein MM300_10135 [Evansella sp. LMS18]
MSLKKAVISIAVLAVLIIGGFLSYSAFASPELKLVKAVNDIMEEDVVQVNTDFSMNIDFSGSPEDFYLSPDEEIYFDILRDLLQNIEGSNSVIVDSEAKVIEMIGSYGISGDIQGENIKLQLPFGFYIDEEADELAFDLDPYADFFPEIVDVFAFNILPYIPEIEQELLFFTNGEDTGEWISREVNTVLGPVLENTLRGAKFTDSLDLEESIFPEDGEEEYLAQFMLEHIFDYLNEHGGDSLVTERDDRIYLELDEDLMLHSILHSLREVEADEEAREAFEKGSDESVESVISDFEEMIDEIEKLSISFVSGFKIESGRIVESDTEAVISITEDGVTVDMSVTADSSYIYDRAEFSFYGHDRIVFTESDFDEVAYELEMQFENRMGEIFLEMEEDFYFDEDYDDSAYEYDYDLTDEDLEFIAMIEAQEVSHEDFGFTPEEMYELVLELELSGLVEPGTSDLYLD